MGVTEFKAEFSGMLDLHKRFVWEEFNIGVQICKSKLINYSKSGLSITVMKMYIRLNGKPGPHVPE